MNNLLKELKFSGKGLMSGKDSEVTLKISDNKGIRFFINGSNKPVLAYVDNVVSTQNCTVIGNETSVAPLIEHFMAACAFCGIDALDVYLSGYEMPIFDGSSKFWVEEFRKAGFYKEETSFINIDQPIEYKEENSSIKIEPADSFKVSYTINFDHPDLKEKTIEWAFEEEDWEIIEARTFGYLKDLEKFQSIGMALGVDETNTVGLTENGYTTELRSDYEPVKHKILDLVGDLYLTGINPLSIKGHITAEYAGHKSHTEFAKILRDYLLSKEN